MHLTPAVMPLNGTQGVILLFAEKPVLDLGTRKIIALGAALGAVRGLLYLHEQCDPKIIHRDEAANILLDK